MIIYCRTYGCNFQTDGDDGDDTALARAFIISISCIVYRIVFGEKYKIFVDMPNMSTISLDINTNDTDTVSDLKLKIQRIASDEAKLKEAITRRAAPPSSSSLSSHLKLPRIQIPQFQDNARGTISWPNFHSILVRLTAGMNPKERIFLT